MISILYDIKFGYSFRRSMTIWYSKLMIIEAEKSSMYTLHDMKNFHVKNLPDGELNPGLPRDRRGYSPLYNRGFDEITLNFWMVICGFPESYKKKFLLKNSKIILPDRELNPGLPRDRRGYLPLYYRGFDGVYNNTS